MAKIEYDNSAFYYFVITMLSLYLFPATFWTIQRILRLSKAKGSDDDGKARSMGEKKKLRELAAKKEVLWNKCFTYHTIFLGLIWVLWFMSLYAVWGNAEIIRYDPCDVLEISAEDCADPKKVKKQYHKLSIKYHPDKNKDRKEWAAEMFIKISKAYQGLTDEEAIDNLNKFGSVDGKGAMAVGIGLPDFFRNADNHTIILIVYLVFTVIMVPVAVGYTYASFRKYAANDVMKQTYLIFQRHITATSTERDLPEVLAAAQEFANLQYSADDQEQLQDLYRLFGKNSKNMKERGEDRIMAPPKVYTEAQANQVEKMKGDASSIRTAIFNNILLHYHLLERNRYETDGPKIVLTDGNRANLDAMLSKNHLLLDAMINIGKYNGWFKTVINAIELSQKLTQGVWGRYAEMLQLPHFDQESIKHATGATKRRSVKGNKITKSAAFSLVDFVKQDKDKRKGMAKFDEQQKEEVDKVCKLIPQLSVHAEAVVIGEPVIGPKDVVTARITVFRDDLQAEQFHLECSQDPIKNTISVEKSMGTFQRHGTCNGKAKYKMSEPGFPAAAVKVEPWLFYVPTGDDVTGIWVVGPKAITVYPDYERPKFLGWLRSEQVLDAGSDAPAATLKWYSKESNKAIESEEYIPKPKANNFAESDDDEDDGLKAKAIQLEDGFEVEEAVTGKQIKEASEAEKVHAPFMPDEINDDLHIVMAVKPKGRTALEIRGHIKKKDISREVMHDMKFLAPPQPGKFEFKIFVKSSSYVGVDVETHFTMEVLPKEKIRVIESHPDDTKLLTMPSRFELMLNPELAEEQEDSDDSDDEDDISNLKRRVPHSRRLKEAKENKAAESDDSEDD